MRESGKAPLELKKKQLTPKQQKKHNFQLGEAGESLAAKFLQQKNYQILERNLRFKNKEIDLIALDKKHQEIVFVEVKTRKNDRFGSPSKAVNYKKIHNMRVVAIKYLEKLDSQNSSLNNCDYRFDTISVISGKIQHYQNITW